MADGELPPRIFWLLTFHDVIWWIPFGMFLIRSHLSRDRTKGTSLP